MPNKLLINAGPAFQIPARELVGGRQSCVGGLLVYILTIFRRCDKDFMKEIKWIGFIQNMLNETVLFVHTCNGISAFLHPAGSKGWGQLSTGPSAPGLTLRCWHLQRPPGVWGDGAWGSKRKALAFWLSPCFNERIYRLTGNASFPPCFSPEVSDFPAGDAGAGHPEATVCQ